MFPLIFEGAELQVCINRGQISGNIMHLIWLKLNVILTTIDVKMDLVITYSLKLKFICSHVNALFPSADRQTLADFSKNILQFISPSRAGSHV